MRAASSLISALSLACLFAACNVGDSHDAPAPIEEREPPPVGEEEPPPVGEEEPPPAEEEEPPPAEEEEPPPTPENDLFRREGYGADTTGGAGGMIYEVSTLQELENAIAQSGPRIVRQVSSDPILTTSSLEVREPNITLENLYVYNAAGNTDHTVRISTHDVIVRNSRIYNPVLTDKDVVSIVSGAYDVFFERNTLLFGSDETINTWYDVHRVTFAWNIIGYPLNHDQHGYGPLFGAADRNGRDVSFHHNLITTSRYRNPKVDLLGGFSMWNNVIYNCGDASNTLLQPNAPGDFYAAVVGNYYKEGPNSNAVTAITAEEHGSVYVADNVQDGSAATVEISGSVTSASAVPSQLPPMTVSSAQQAYQDVLDFAGANYDNRDALTLQIITDVQQGTSPISGKGNWVNHPDDVNF